MERIPILKMGRFLLVTIQVDMHDELAMTLQEDLTSRIVKDRAQGVLIDISSLEIVDSFIGRMIGNIAGMARMLDAETVLVGMRPAVAITLVELGMTLTGVRTALNVDKGMAMLQTAQKEKDASVEVIKDGSASIESSSDVVRVRQMVREWAVAIGFSLVDQTKMVTAASELARNAFEHGGGGTVRLESLNNANRRGLRLTFTDQGEGIADVEQALKDGFTTGGGMGLGLGGAKRLVNDFAIDSTPGQGTRVTIVRWRPS